MIEKSKEVAVVNDVNIMTREKIVQALDMFGLQKVPEQIKGQFIEICMLMNLNPFLKEVYVIPFSGSFQIVVGYHVYLKRAEATGVLNGWQCEYLEKPNRVKITIHRKDWQHPFVYEAFEAEFKKTSPIWLKMPRLMMQKCAMSAAFRICFPVAFVGMPYTHEEMDVDAPGVIDTTAKAVITATEATEVPEDVKGVMPQPNDVPPLKRGNPEKAMLQIDNAKSEGEIMMYKKIIMEERSWTKDELQWLSERIDKRILEFKNRLLEDTFK